MDTVEIPPRFSQRSPRLEGRPPLTDQEAREEKKAGMAVENNRLRRRAALAQVYSLQFLRFGEDDQRQLYGTVSIGVRFRAQNIFDRQIGKGNSYHDIDQKGYLRLSGPPRAINGMSSIVVIPRLFKKNDNSGLFHPARIDDLMAYETRKGLSPLPSCPVEKNGIKGMWLLTERQLDDSVLAKLPHLEMPHNKVLRDLVDTTVGPMAIIYSVFRDGMEAFLCIKILSWGKESGQPANIYGTVVASSAMLKEPMAKSFVLDLKRDEHTPVRAYQFIPLQRPSIAVPHGHEFKLDLCIMHRDFISGEDQVIAKGNLSFTPKCWFEGSNEYILESRDVLGESPLVQVEVFWTPWWAIH